MLVDFYIFTTIVDRLSNQTPATGSNSFQDVLAGTVHSEFDIL